VDRVVQMHALRDWYTYMVAGGIGVRAFLDHRAAQTMLRELKEGPRR